MRASNLAPDNADLGASDLFLSPVNIGDLLAAIETKPEVSGYNEVVFALFSPTSSTYLAAEVLSTPSILIKLVPGCVTLRER